MIHSPQFLIDVIPTGARFLCPACLLTGMADLFPRSRCANVGHEAEGPWQYVNPAAIIGTTGGSRGGPTERGKVKIRTLKTTGCGTCPPQKRKIFGLGCRLAWPPFDLLIEGHMRYVLLIYDDEKGWAKLNEADRQH